MSTHILELDKIWRNLSNFICVWHQNTISSVIILVISYTIALFKD